MGPFDVHHSYHRCWPWDLDPWMELNNGRTLTLYDLGRIPMAVRIGLVDALRSAKWGLTVAGVSVRYRQRIRMFERVAMQTRLIGWDDRFLYMEQSMWNGKLCANHILVRAAVVDFAAGGIVAPERVVERYKPGLVSPPLPDWVQQWIASERARPWPPVAVDPPA
ncbi:MAG: thioesterase family protein [Pirellulaceae bacterium]|nr:thioesterase family protein [Pirellulaceae bacterium]